MTTEREKWQKVFEEKARQKLTATQVNDLQQRRKPMQSPRTTPLAHSFPSNGSPLPKPNPDEPHIRPNEDGSITALKALVPIRVATSRVLEGKWSGRALHAHRVLPSVFGGKHFILQLGYTETIGSPATGEDEDVPTFRLVFVVNLPVEDKHSLDDPLQLADAARTAEALMHMLNLRRIP
jgi:hypothetical protein